jgi:hypothetical protein
VSGVQAGDYDYAEFMSGDLYDTLKSDSAISIHRNGAPLFGLFFINSKLGILKDNFALRRAIQTAFKEEEALRVSFGTKSLWEANGALYPRAPLVYRSRRAAILQYRQCRQGQADGERCGL